MYIELKQLESEFFQYETEKAQLDTCKVIDFFEYKTQKEKENAK